MLLSCTLIPGPPVQAQTTAKKGYSASSSRARRLMLARARAAAALKEAATPKFKLDADGQQVPDIRAAAAIVYDPENGSVLWESNSQDVRSIASITKVMTALVFLESNPDLTQDVLIDRNDVRRASVTYLRSGERVRAGDLLHLLLIASDNGAARALARVSPIGYTGFIDRMMEKAIELGLESASFADPSGLDARNVASAYDISRLIAYAATHETIAPIMRMASHSFTTSSRTLTIKSTNKLLLDGDLGGNVDVRGGKTGFISKSGYCLATLLKLPHGEQVAVVVLGARSSAGRFWETRHLFNWLSGKAQEIFGKTATPQPED
jgi:D-alanyl-D-alanine endopeptidase (penicillin-binding protein 7)